MKSGLLLLLALSNVCVAANVYDPGLTLERSRVHLVIHADGTSVETRERTWRVDGPQGVEMAGSDSIQYASTSEDVTDVRAWSTTPDGVRLRVADSMIRTQDEFSREGVAEFSDLKSRTAIFPAVQVGSRNTYAVSVRRHHVEYPGYFGHVYELSEAFRVEDWQLDLDVPAGMKLAIEANRVEGGLVGSGKGLDQYRFRFTNAVARARDEDAVSLPRDRAHVAISTYADPLALGRAYQQASRPMAELTPALRERALSLVAGLASTAEKVRALHHWVARNIRYVYVGIGDGKLVPHRADEVLAKLYGDCKDHAILLEALLTASGIESSPALVNLGAAFDLPTVGVVSPFNHVITYVPSLDLYVDSTDAFTTHGNLVHSLFDKPTVLTALDRIGHTPRMRAEDHAAWSEQEMSVHADGSVSGRATMHATGAFDQYSRQERFDVQGTSEDKVVKDWLDVVGEQGTGHIEHGDPQALDTPFWVKTEFELEPVGNVPGPAAITVPVGLSAGILSAIAASPPPAERHDAWRCLSRTIEEDTLLHQPASLDIRYVPVGVSLDDHGYRYESRYEREGQDIRVHRRFVEQHEGGACGQADHEARLRFQAVLRRDLRSQLIYQ